MPIADISTVQMLEFLASGKMERYSFLQMDAAEHFEIATSASAPNQVGRLDH